MLILLIRIKTMYTVLIDYSTGGVFQIDFLDLPERVPIDWHTLLRPNNQCDNRLT